MEERGGIITNPAVVKSAINNKKEPAASPRSKKKGGEKSARNGTPKNGGSKKGSNGRGSGDEQSVKDAKSDAKAGKPDGLAGGDGNNNNGKKRNKPKNPPKNGSNVKAGSESTPSPQQQQQQQRPPVQSKRGADAPQPPSDPIADTTDIKRQLFPGLYDQAPEQATTTMNSTPPRAPQQTGMPNAKGRVVFAGSSFHSSPAPSALPRPSFKKAPAAAPASPERPREGMPTGSPSMAVMDPFGSPRQPQPVPMGVPPGVHMPMPPPPQQPMMHHMPGFDPMVMPGLPGGVPGMPPHFYGPPMGGPVPAPYYGAPPPMPVHHPMPVQTSARRQ